MENEKEVRVATPETIAAVKAEVDKKIEDAKLGGVSFVPITAEEVRKMFRDENSNENDGEAE